MRYSEVVAAGPPGVCGAVSWAALAVSWAALAVFWAVLPFSPRLALS